MKALSKFISSGLLAITLLNATPAKAALGVMAGTMPFIGVVFLTGGIAGGAGGAILYKKAFGKNIGMIIPIAIGAAAAYLGICILDGEQTLGFSELDETTAKAVGVTPEERESYNAELDQVNFLLSEVKEHLSQIEKPTEADSVKAWSEVKDLVSPLTFQAMGKIVAQNLK